MADQLQLRGGTTAEHSTFTGALREVTVDTDKDTVVVHDGSTAGGHPLAKQNLSNVPAGTITSTMIADGTIVNADVNASAAIAGTKISPDFGSQTIQTTGVVSHALGTAAAPTLTFTGDTNTGIYSPGADQVAISTNGTGRLTIDSSGNVNIDSGTVYVDAANNRLGVGTTTPTLKLSVDGDLWNGNGSGAEVGRLFNDPAGVYHLRASSNMAGLALGTNGTEKARIDNSGRLGIGTSSVAEKLHVDAGNLLVRQSDFQDPYIKISQGTSTTGNKSILYFADSSGNTSAITGYGSAYGSGLNKALQLSTNGTAAVTIDSSQRVGIGTTSPAFNLDVSGSGTQTIRSITTDTSGTAIGRFRAFYVGGGGGTQSAVDLRAGDNYAYLLAESNVPLLFGTNNTERARIDSSGRLLVGTSSSPTGGDHTQYAKFFNVGNTSGAGAGVVGIGRATAASSGTITAGVHLGSVTFTDSAGFEFSRIESYADATAGSGDYPGRLVFSTTADGASSPTERMRIQANGLVLIGTQTAYASGTTIGGGEIFSRITSDRALTLRRDTTDGTIAEFRRDATTVGTISVTTTATAYNTSSDYRLKENVTAVTDGITRLQQLKPSRFNFIADPDTVVDGFIAHEVQTIVPEAITGEKDAVDDEGNPEYQGIDQSKLVPLLTAALQEAVAKIESLEARLTAAGI